MWQVSLALPLLLACYFHWWVEKRLGELQVDKKKFITKGCQESIGDSSAFNPL